MNANLIISLFSVLATETFGFTIPSHPARGVSALLAEKEVISLTREEGKNDKLRKLLIERLGGSARLEELPCIAHVDGDDLEKLPETLNGIDFDYIVVTSPEAARVLAPSWKNCDKAAMPSVAVVGKGTQQTLESLDIPVDFCPSKATGKVLAEELPSKRETTTVLYPASAKAATTVQKGLTARGFAVTRLNTYSTTTATWSDEQKKISEKTRVACFGSPSAIKGWLKNTSNNKEVLAACIGETSATACRELEWPDSKIFFPEKPGIPGWAQAVEEALQESRVHS